MRRGSLLLLAAIGCASCAKLGGTVSTPEELADVASSRNVDGDLLVSLEGNSEIDLGRLQLVDGDLVFLLEPEVTRIVLDNLVEVRGSLLFIGLRPEIGRAEPVRIEPPRLRTVDGDLIVDQLGRVVWNTPALLAVGFRLALADLELGPIQMPNLVSAGSLHLRGLRRIELELPVLSQCGPVRGSDWSDTSLSLPVLASLRHDEMSLDLPKIAALPHYTPPFVDNRSFVDSDLVFRELAHSQVNIPRLSALEGSAEMAGVQLQVSLPALVSAPNLAVYGAFADLSALERVGRLRIGAPLAAQLDRLVQAQTVELEQGSSGMLRFQGLRRLDGIRIAQTKLSAVSFPNLTELGTGDCEQPFSGLNVSNNLELEHFELAPNAQLRGPARLDLLPKLDVCAEMESLLRASACVDPYLVDSLCD